MKYMSQFCIILGFALAGEALQMCIPLPIPASVYGLVLLFAALCLKIVRVEQVKDAGAFLTGIMSVLFVAPAVGIVEHWALIQPRLLPIALLIFATTMLTFGISGGITQLLRRKGGETHD